MFKVWSGLKINRGKTYLSIFGASLGRPTFVYTLRVTWWTEFKLLCLNFDQCLGKMDRNYLDCFDKVKKELSSWRHIFLTVFGKKTVIKTMCIPKLTHIATVIPNLSLGCQFNVGHGPNNTSREASAVTKVCCWIQLLNSNFKKTHRKLPQNPYTHLRGGGCHAQERSRSD